MNRRSTEFSRSQALRLWMRRALARSINTFSVVLAGLVLFITTASALAAPAEAVATLEDPSGNVVAAWQPSTLERAALGLSGGSVEPLVSSEAPMVLAAGVDPVASGLCNPDDPTSWCYEQPPPPDSVCTMQSVYGNPDTETLPVHRWTDGTSSLHTRLSSQFYNDVMEKVSRNGLQQALMSFGNMFWSAGVTMTESASKFCIGDNIGVAIDNGMGNIADAVFNNAFVGALLVTAGIVAALWRASRTGSFPLAAAGRFMVVAGLIVAMFNGAQNSAGSTYGTFSPGWMYNTVNRVIGQMAGAMNVSLLDFTEGLDTSGALGTQSPRDKYAENYNSHCDNYVQALRDHYDSKYALANVKGMTAAPKALDSIWTESALKSYTTTQFGSGNAYGEASYCHQLEYNSGTSPDEHAWFTEQALSGEYVSSRPPSTAGGRDIYTPSTNEATDMVMVFWGTCVNASGAGGAWEPAPGWAGISNPGGIVSGGGEVTADECNAAYASNGDGYGWKGSTFDWGSRDNIVNATDYGHWNATSTYGVTESFHPRQFLMNYQGHSVTDGLVGAGIHALVGLLMMLLFGALSLVVLIAKLAILPLFAMVYFVAMADLIFGRASSRLVKFAKLLLGMVIVTWGSSFLLSFIAALSKIINDLGRALDLNVVGTILWAGLAPILAVFLLKFVFDKILKMPDPLSINGAKAYLGGAGSLGGAALDRMARMPQQLSTASWQRLTGTGQPAPAGGVGSAGRGGSRGSLGAHSAGRGRTDAMAPEMPETQGALAGAAAAGGAAGVPARAATRGGARGAGRGGMVDTRGARHSLATTRDTAMGGALAVRARGRTGDGADEFASRRRLPAVRDRAGRAIQRFGGSAARARDEFMRQNPDWAPAVGRGAQTRLGRDASGLPAELAGSWGRTGDGLAVQRARMIREGRAVERQAIGGHSETGPMGWAGRLRNRAALRRTERALSRQALAARRKDMGIVGATVDRAGEIGRNLTSGKVAAGAAAVGMGASLAAAGSFAAVTLAPAAIGGAAIVGSVAAARKLRERRSGAHQARRAARNERSMRTFLAQRETQVADENARGELAGLHDQDVQDAAGASPGGAPGDDGPQDGLPPADGPEDDGPGGGGGGGGGPLPGPSGGGDAPPVQEPPADGYGSDEAPPIPVPDGDGEAPRTDDGLDAAREALARRRQAAADAGHAVPIPVRAPVSEPDPEGAYDVVPQEPPADHRSVEELQAVQGTDPGSPEQDAATDRWNEQHRRAERSAPQTPGPGPQEGGDAPAGSGSGASDRSRTEARRDIFDLDGRTTAEVRAERDIFSGHGVDPEARARRADTFRVDPRNDAAIAAERSVFDHDGRVDELTEARKDVFDHDGRSDVAHQAGVDAYHDRQAARAGQDMPTAASVSQSQERREHGRRLQQAMRDAEPGSPEQQAAREAWDAHRAEMRQRTADEEGRRRRFWQR